MIHRLLKGRFQSRNYVLITRDAADILAYDGEHARKGSVLLEHIGRVDYLVLGEEVLQSLHPVIAEDESAWEQLVGTLQLVFAELRTPFRHLFWRPLQQAI